MPPCRSGAARLTFFALVAVALVFTERTGVRAQSGTRWVFEDVSAITLNPCMRGATLAGFDHDPGGRPVVAWREENSCGYPWRIFWTRKEGGVWNAREFLSERRYDGGATDGYFHHMILRPSDGNPFLVYRDVAPGNSLYTVRTDLGAYPTGGV